MEIASQQIGQTWFPARVTSKTGSGTAARYSWVSLWVESSGNVANMPYQPEGNATTSTFAGVCLTGDDLSVGDEVLARPAMGAGGYLYELFPSIGGASETNNINLLINGNFYFNQRTDGTIGANQTLQAGNVGNFSYDRWYVFSSTANIAYTNLANQTMVGANAPDGTNNFGAFRQTSGANGSIVLCQVVENQQSKPFSNQTLTLSFATRSSLGNVTVKAAVFNYTGTFTPDSVSVKGGLVANWTGNAPSFNMTSRQELGNTSANASNTAWSNVSLTVSTSAVTNLIAAIWAENLPSNTTIFFAKAGLGPEGYEWIEPQLQDEYLRCARFFFRPNFSSAVNTVCTSNLTSISTYLTSFYAPSAMRLLPSLTHGYSNASNYTMFTGYTSGNHATGLFFSASLGVAMGGVATTVSFPSTCYEITTNLSNVTSLNLRGELCAINELSLGRGYCLDSEI